MKGMTYRERLELVELELDGETARALDRVAQYSDGKLDRAGAARLALARGLPDVLREAELHAAQHLVVCPRCKTEGMFPAQANELLLQGCGACGGVWMDDPSSRRLVAEPSEEAVRLADLAAHNAKRPVSVEATLSCPVCTEPMKHHDFPNARLRLDVCATHGTWFDRGELPVLVALVADEQRKRTELAQAITSAEVDAEIRQVKDLYQSGFEKGYGKGYARGSNFNMY
jgi:Zn-finger nucleic acid-binding protein